MMGKRVPIFILFFGLWMSCFTVADIYAEYGNKTANLLKLKPFLESIQMSNDYRFTIPEFVGITDDEMKAMLKRVNFALKKIWQTFIKQFSHIQRHHIIEQKKLPDNFLAQLKKIENFLAQACTKISENFVPKKLKDFLKKSKKQGWQLMVRSSGKEDTCKCSNAGGNHTEINVKPSLCSLLKAVSNVLASYLSEKSLLQRLQAGDKAIFDEPFVPVLIQRMVGESSINDSSISRGCVAYSREMNAGVDGITMIQATYGHTQGVVESLVPVDTFYCDFHGNIDQVITLKNKRLVPEANQTGLCLRNNPQELMCKPALNFDQVKVIDRSARMLHAWYGYPVDLELICCPDEKTFYLVQVRPLVACRKSETSSYVEMQHDAVCIHCTSLVSGNCSVQHITSSEQFISASTLDEALDSYLKSPKKDAIVALLVEHEAEATSHAAAILRSEGKIVLTRCQMSYIAEWLANQNIDFWIDTQREMIIQQRVAPRIHTGWLSYPLPLMITLPDLSNYVNGKREKDDCPELSYQTLVEKIKQAGASEVDSILGLLIAKIQKNMIMLYREFRKKDSAVSSLIQSNAFNALIKMASLMQYCFDMRKRIVAAVSLPAPEHLYPVRFLEAALFQKQHEQGINTYSVASVMQDYEQRKNFIEKTVLLYGKKKRSSIAFLCNQTFFDYAYQGVECAITQDISCAWLSFLDNFYQAASKYERIAFDKLMKIIMELGLFSEWLNSSFAGAYQIDDGQEQQEEALECFYCLSQEYEEVQESVQVLQKYKSRVSSIPIAAWDEPIRFDQHFQHLQKDIFSYFLSSDFSDLLETVHRTDNVLFKLLITSLLQQTTQVVDMIIKTVKGSVKYASFPEKTKHLKKLLHLYLAFAEKLGINPYLATVIERTLLNASCDADQLIASRSFNVGNVLYLEKVLSSMHKKPKKVSLKKMMHVMMTLEDAFTSLHQLLLYKTGQLIIDWGLDDALEIPPLVARVQEELALDNELTGIMFGRENVVYFYHEKLRAHSLALSLDYSVKRKSIALTLQFYGENEYSRWTVIKDYLTLVACLTGLEVKQLQVTSKGFSGIILISPQTDLSWLDGMLQDIIDITFNLALEHRSTIYQKTYKFLFKLFKKLQQHHKTDSSLLACIQQQIQKGDLNLFVIPALKHLSCDNKDLITLFDVLFKKAKALWEENDEDTTSLVFLLLEAICKKMNVLFGKDDQEIFRLAQTDFGLLAHTMMELNEDDDNDEEEEVVEILIEEIKKSMDKMGK